MTQYFSSDIDFNGLQDKVLQSLHEPVGTGSEAVPLDLVKDTINAVYAEAFNDQRMKPSAREADVSFLVANDTTLATDSLAGATTLVFSATSTWGTSGKLIMGSDIIKFTGNNGTDTLSGVTGAEIPHTAGEIARKMYLLSSVASNIDAEQIIYIDLNGIIQKPMAFDSLINPINFFPNSYAVLEGYLIFSAQSTIGGTSEQRHCLLIYTQQVTPLSSDTDKPTLIANSWRVPILAYGACMKIAAEDAFRTSWDFWDKEFNKALSQYIAFKNNRVRDQANRRRPSVYSGFGFNR